MPWNLVSVSQERGHTLAEYNGRYYRDNSDGQNVPVYVIDTGANKEHVVSRATKADNGGPC